MSEILPVIVLLVFVAIFGIALLYVASLFGPIIKPSAVKQSTYECGIIPQETGHSRVSVKFYLTAILFILFDVEIIFLYPWAISFTDFIEAGSGLPLLIAMGIFLAIFIFGLFWEVKSKALEWE